MLQPMYDSLNENLEEDEHLDWYWVVRMLKHAARIASNCQDDPGDAQTS